MSEHSGNLLLNGEMTAEKAIKFLDGARSYFAGRTTGGEDSAYWANVYNAEWCEKISAFIGAREEKVRSTALEALAVSDTNNELAYQLSTYQARLSEAVKVMEPFAKCSEVYPLADGQRDAGFAGLHDSRCPLKISDYHAARQFIDTIKGDK